MSTSSSTHLTILYATETGNAQEYADRVARRCRGLGLQGRVFSMDKYPLTDLVSEHLIVFVVATAGTGKEPRTMAQLWRMLLRSDLPSDLLDHLQYAVFGLGDSAYDKFCWPAKRLSRRLDSLSAVEIILRGEGDSQHALGTDGTFDPWLDSLANQLATLYSIPQNSSPAENILPPPRVSLTDASVEDLRSAHNPILVDPDYHTFTLTANERITSSDWYQDVRHLEFRTEDDIIYDPGDIAVIRPEASELDVEAFLMLMGWANTMDDPFNITHVFPDQSLPDYLPTISTLRQVFTRYLDFNAVPKRSFFKTLLHFTSDARERERLDEFVSAEGAEDLYDYTLRVRRSVREVLEEFRNVKIPKDYIFDVFPPLRPREFSIASSSKRHPNEVHICAGIVQYRTKLKIPRRGVGTTYLAVLQLGHQLRIGITKGLLTLPKDTLTPVVCIGPGTGIAPMRALLEQRILRGAQNNTLYFGCRSADKDQHYRTQWEEYAVRGELTYRVACSRDGPAGAKRIYVQALMEQDAPRLWQLIWEKNACVYISGSSNKMPAGVRRSLEYVARQEGNMGEDEAQAYVANMEREGRLMEECWS
ncbi:riboflavin synthase domain-like protein [Auriscalpium vulgare]|uniref:Riboflavin synthase domain-like protein n=1 Tax=Auriscalpium vulgare TaxID=40419 RepID=A0ACB8S977_9AGAM|nr:riboflavin synthase domain-like protein [Auriscalpium vulgare]